MKLVFAKHVYKTLANKTISCWETQRVFACRHRSVQKEVVDKKRVLDFVASPDRGILKKTSPGKFVPENVFAYCCKFGNGTQSTNKVKNKSG